MIPASVVRKMHEEHPNIEDLLEAAGPITFFPPLGRDPGLASVQTRRLAIEHAIPVFTSVDTALAMLRCLSMNQTMEDVELVDITKL